MTEQIEEKVREIQAKSPVVLFFLETAPDAENRIIAIASSGTREEKDAIPECTYL